MFQSLVAFLKKPFNPDGTAVQWFAFIGLILVLLWMWHAAARDFQMIERAA